MQEKQGVVRPGLTPDTERRLPQEKTAATQDREEQAAILDDDVMHRAADIVAGK